MQDSLQFRVSAELKNILGRDLITSPDVAILELVKNSYDAHAAKVEITFDDDYLRIADNGKGMSKDDLINKWLFVAYSAKSDGTEDSSYRSKFKRHYAGAKGIGRMSCDRLAQYLTLATRSLETNKTEVLHVDWGVFEKDKHKEFDAIDIPHETQDSIPPFPNQSATGTILEFKGLHNDWGKEEILAIKKSLEKMINPFSGTDDNFQIEIIAPQFIDHDEEVEHDYKKVNGVIENSIVDVLRIKTTKIESTIQDGMIHTILFDRDTKMYEIKEVSKFPKLISAQVSLFYLNRAAKRSFTTMMGIQPVNYGNIFLFRNGFRILPYGDFRDDSWGLNQRAQQGYNRFLGTRDLFGRVDVETDDVNAIKEVSSRDGGLIQTEASKQLMEYFTLIHRRLERYVVGVLWGERFIRKDYFKTKQIAERERKNLQDVEKKQDSTEHLYKNIGSKVDFLQLIKSLVNDENVAVVYYNSELADIVSNTSNTEIVQMQMFEDARKVASQTDDSYLMDKIALFERQMDELRKQKEESDRKAEDEKEKARKAQQKAEKEKEKRKKVQKELEQKNKQNLFLLSVGTLDKDRILKYHHDIRIHTSTIHNTIGQLLKKAYSGLSTNEEVIKLVERIARANNKITSIAQFATKANYSTETDIIQADIVDYISEYINNVLPEFYSELTLNCITNSCSKVLDFMPLEACIFVDNLISNTSKFHAKQFNVIFDKDLETGTIDMVISDDGDGLSSKIINPENILEKGYTTTNGSGLGLYNVATFVRNVLKGSIIIDTNQNKSGFKLIIKF